MNININGTRDHIVVHQGMIENNNQTATMKNNCQKKSFRIEDLLDPGENERHIVSPRSQSQNVKEPNMTRSSESSTSSENEGSNCSTYGGSGSTSVFHPHGLTEDGNSPPFEQSAILAANSAILMPNMGSMIGPFGGYGRFPGETVNNGEYVPIAPNNAPFHSPFLTQSLINYHSYDLRTREAILFSRLAASSGILFAQGRPINGVLSLGSKRKGGQIRFSNSQTAQLEKAFRDHKYLNASDRKKLAVSLHLSDRQVKTWFQNRRAKLRKSQDGRLHGLNPGDVSNPSNSSFINNSHFPPETNAYVGDKNEDA